MSQKSSEMASQNENVAGQASPCKRPGPDQSHDGPILKKASGSKKVPEVQTPKSMSEGTRDSEEVESAIREYEHRQEIGRLERELIFERQQNVDLVGEYERKVYTLKKDHEAQLHALEERISLLENTKNESGLDETQSENKQKDAQRQNKSITEEQNQVMENVEKGDQTSIEKDIFSKDKNEDSEMEEDYRSNREAVWTYLEVQDSVLGPGKEPDVKSHPFLELFMKYQQEDTNPDDDDDTSMQSFGVDTDGMTLYEFTTFFELQKVLRQLNKKHPRTFEEEDQQDELSDRLLTCMNGVRIVPEPKYDASLARVRDLVQTFDRTESLLATDTKKALDGLSLGELLKVKDSLKKTMDEFTQKFDSFSEVKASAIYACGKIGEPKVTSSMSKFAFYVDYLERELEAFWRINECVTIVAETGRALNVVKRVEKALRECSKDKEGKA
ncbi:hypothetical protein OXX79_008120 [Metschnikowia pulcherrima]